MTGAQNTLPMLLSNTLFCLSRQPDIGDRLRAEVACVGPDALTIGRGKKVPIAPQHTERVYVASAA